MATGFSLEIRSLPRYNDAAIDGWYRFCRFRVGHRGFGPGGFLHSPPADTPRLCGQRSRRVSMAAMSRGLRRSGLMYQMAGSVPFS